MNYKTYHLLTFQKLMILTILIINMTGTGELLSQTTDWLVPTDAASISNPVEHTSNSLLKGKILFKQNCAICHGKKGRGDGVAGMALSPKPSDFTSDRVKSESDGGIFWKMSEGRGQMVAYKGILTETQRWHLVNYIRKLQGN